MLCYRSILFSVDSGPHYSLAKVHEGGQLIINNVEPSRDQGTYTCIVRSRAGEEARREVQLNVNSKKKKI